MIFFVVLFIDFIVGLNKFSEVNFIYFLINIYKIMNIINVL